MKEADQQSIERDDTIAPSVSIVIPVYNDADRLERCLSAMFDNDYPGPVEVIVIDNGSTDHLDDVRAQFPEVVWLHESRPGSYSARNKGLRAATGEIIAFTDSDCRPMRSWLQSGVKCLVQQPTVALAGGRIEVFIEAGGTKSGVAMFERRHSFPQQLYAERFHFAATANAFSRAEVLHLLGGFDGSLRSGGDKDLGRRIHALGHQVVYCEDAVVQHPARTTWREVNKKFARTHAGDRDAFGRPNTLTFLRQLGSALVPPVRTVSGALRDRSFDTIGDRLRYCGAVVGVRYLGAWHRIRTQLSDSSPR